MSSLRSSKAHRLRDCMRQSSGETKTINLNRSGMTKVWENQSWLTDKRRDQEPSRLAEISGSGVCSWGLMSLWYITTQGFMKGQREASPHSVTCKRLTRGYKKDIKDSRTQRSNILPSDEAKIKLFGLSSTMRLMREVTNCCS